MDGPTLEDGTTKPLQKFWAESNSLTDRDVLKYIKCLDTQRNEKESRDDADHSTWVSPPNPLCAASFGDGGMTATVNSYGLLMQFGDYLGIGRSGLFTADHDSVSEPYLVASRARDLDNMTKEPSLLHGNYGLSLSGRGLVLRPGMQPQLSWKQWRWPCYRYTPEQFADSRSSFTVDWMVHGKTLLHRCVLETSPYENSEIDIRFLKNLRIRDLDHMEGDFSTRFNGKENARMESGPGPGRCTWIWLAPYKPSQTGQEVVQTEDPGQEASVNPGEPEDEGSDGQPSETWPQPTEISLGYFQREGVKPPKISITEATENQDLEFLADERREKVENTTNGPCVVAVLAAVFVNGVPKQFQNEQNWSSPQIWTEELRKMPWNTTHGTKRLDIVTAYRILLLPPFAVDWTDLVIKAEDVDMESFTKSAALHPEYLLSSGGHLEIPQTSLADIDYETNVHKYQYGIKGPDNTSKDSATDAIMSSSRVKEVFGIPRPDCSPSDHIEYMIWRNLEHILSVCSIPVGSKTEDGIQPVALTCGDMSMHRICTSASFFAIQFLIEVSKRLHHSKDKPKDVRNLQERIRKVCLGHIRWLLSTDKSKSGDFAANYWATGKIYPSEDDSGSWQASEGVVNTPFQILKAAEVSSFYTGDETAQSLCEILLKCIRNPWLKRLHEMDPRIKFAWPHAVEEGINIFRLDDHVWIWRALKALYDLNLWEGWNHSSDKRKSSIKDMQRETLQRFTMKNDDSGKRMLAVTRSVKEQRFIFHARDTALFYGLEFFMQSTSSRELWENTVEAQAQHDDNQEMTWDNAIRYALAIIMGLHGSRINQANSASEHVQSAVRTLLRTTSPNGFFPGQLFESADGKPIPALYDTEAYRDFYFHAHFEISYILLLNIGSISRQSPRSIPKQKENSTPKTSSPKELSRLGHNVQSQLEKISSDLESLTERISMQQKHNINMSNEKYDRRTATAMQKIFPFESSAESNKIMEIDDEWLFNYPAFLEKQQSPLPAFTEISTMIKRAKGMASGDLISQKLELSADDEKPFEISKQGRWFVAVTDVPRRKHAGKMKNRQQSGIPTTFHNTEDLWNTLKKQRTVEHAKKRLVWIREPDAELAIVFFLTTPTVYQASLSLFFDQHSRQAAHFSDETSKLRNEWKTELLFGFYVLASNKDTVYQQSGTTSASAKSLPTVQENSYAGFRFEGDIFDRYWTCRFIDFAEASANPVPKKTPWLDTGYESFIQSIEIARFLEQESDWSQRKVLELLLAGRMLNTILQTSGTIIQKLRIEVDRVLKSYAQSSSDQYLTVHLVLPDLFESLDMSLCGIIDVMNMWDTRERNRAQQPRWTKNDERKYRKRINYLQGSIQGKFKELKQLQVDTRALREKFVLDVAKISEHRSRSKEENLRLFTYVTVVFLPLGFATSIFSMAGTPDTPLLIDMITCAIVALILTGMMLLNAQSLAGMARDTSRAIHTFSLEKMEGSQLAKYRTIKHTRSGTSKGKEFLKTEDDEKSWYLIFWIAYVLVEFPARRVFAASRVLISLNHGKQVSRDPGNTAASAPTSILGSAFRVFCGLVFSPLFVTSWIIQVAICNAWDLLRLIHGIMPSVVSPFNNKMNNESETYPDVWFKPGKWWRPIREMDRRLEHKRDPRVKVAKAEAVNLADEESPAQSDISEQPGVTEGSNSG